MEALQAKGEALAGLSSCEEVESTFVKRRHRVAALLIEVAGRTGLTTPGIEDPSDVLARISGEARSALTSQAEDAGAALEKARTAQAEAAAALVDVRARFELDPGITISPPRADTTAEATVAERQAAELTAAIERDKELAAQASRLTGGNGCSNNWRRTSRTASSSSSCSKTGGACCPSCPRSVCAT